MKITKRNFLTACLDLAVVLAGISTPPLSLAAQTQDDEAPGSRHVCPYKAIRKDGTCDPNPGSGNPNSTASTRKKQPQYKRVAKQASTAAKCNVRVKETQSAKNQNICKLPETAGKPDLPLSSPRVGITIWRVKEAGRDYEGARILSHPESGSVRIQGDPVLAYGERVRLGIESPRDGYLYVFDRELYHDGSLSAPYMIFPATELRGGNNRVEANRLIEVPATTDHPFYFEAKKIGLDPTKRLVGEILSIAITDKPIGNLKAGSAETLVLTTDMDAIEELYAGRAEVFELEDGVGREYSAVERDAASSDGSRMLTHGDPVPQTFFLVENKQPNGVLVSIALKYEGSSDRALLIGVEQYPYPINPVIGAVNDVAHWDRLLRERYGFAPSAIRKLTNSQATDANIRQAVSQWLIAESSPGDRVFLFFGGHGAQVPDYNGDEPEDHRDEAIIPFDAEIALIAKNWVAPTANFIKDDDVSEWLARLSGRRVVFVFDSCFSGSMSRGVMAEKALAESRFLRVREGAEQQLKKFRGLVHPIALRDSDAPVSIRKRFLDRLVNGAVVISAAQSHQEAMPVRNVPEAPMGALSYLLTNLLDSESAMPIGAFESRLWAGIQELKLRKEIRAGANGEFQRPMVDILSQCGLAQAPLFGGGWTSAPATVLFNPLSRTRVSLSFAGGQTLFHAGDLARVNVETNREGYLYLLVFSENDVATCLLPNDRDSPARIGPHTHSFGGYYAKEPFGKDVWVALVTDKPLPLSNVKTGQANYQYKWSEVFDLIGIPELQVQLSARAHSRGFGTQSPVNDWQAATVVVETRAR